MNISIRDLACSFEAGLKIGQVSCRDWAGDGEAVLRRCSCKDVSRAVTRQMGTVRDIDEPHSVIGALRVSGCSRIARKSAIS